MVLFEDWFVLDQSAKMRRQAREINLAKKMISRPYALLRLQVWGGGVVVSKVENPVGHNHSLWKIWADQFINECYLCSCDQKQSPYSETIYSLSLFDHFCPVKRNGEYFAEKWSEQKVLIIKVVGLYSTYQKYKRIGVPNIYSSHQFGENCTFHQKPPKV